MELVDINIIGFQRAKAHLQVLPHLVCRPRSRLCRENDLVAHPGERRADLLLTVRIRARRVVKIDAAVIRLVQQIHGVLFADALNGQAAKAVFLNDKSRLAKRDLVHGSLLLYLSTSSIPKMPEKAKYNLRFDAYKTHRADARVDLSFSRRGRCPHRFSLPS